ncbi:hypothetical protein [Deinococcus aquatilis]|jgi:hypothetical protein|uniref:hypothetical protein n=1 Tax=Deinococcus aquatilis TaxID=519440 RepID=UPI0012F9A9D4|nr:hypothetical protein [Deinococcus aquatilis]
MKRTPWMGVALMVVAGLVLSVLLSATRDMPLVYAGLNTVIYGALGVWAYTQWRRVRHARTGQMGQARWLYLGLMGFSALVILVRLMEAFSGAAA